MSLDQQLKDLEADVNEARENVETWRNLSVLRGISDDENRTLTTLEALVSAVTTLREIVVDHLVSNTRG